MIIEISGTTHSGKTSTVAKLLDKNKYTVVITQDGDIEHVYERVIGTDIKIDFGDKITIHNTNILKFMESELIGEVDNTIINDFLNSYNEVLVLDTCKLPEIFLQSLRQKFKTEYSKDKTLILVNQQILEFSGV